jgi:hypothetical protein
MFAIALLVLGAGGGLLFGGIFTIVLAPIGVIILLGALLSAMWARSTQGQAGGSTDASRSVGRPLPRTRHEPTGHAPTSPERLADARRVEQ